MSPSLRQLILRGRAVLDGVLGVRQAVPMVSLVALVLLAVVAVCWDRQPAGTFAPLYEQRKLSAAEQQRVEASLATAGLLDYEIRQGELWVLASERSHYSAVIATAQCLQDFNSPTEEALRNSSLIEVGTRRNDRLDHAREQEARLALLAIPGIEDAFVYFDQTAPQGLKGERQVSASVGVRTAPDQPLDFEAAQTVQRVVLRLKAGLLPDGITVTDLRSRRSFLGVELADENSATAQSLRQIGKQHRLERDLERMLVGIPGARLGIQMQATENNDGTPRVSVSVGIPTSYLDEIERAERLKNGAQPQLNRARLEQRLRNSIQTAMLPLLPRTADNQPSAESITVTWFDDPLAVAKARAETSLITSRQVVLLALLGSVACAALWFLSAKQRDPAPQLKVYTEPDLDRHGDSDQRIDTPERDAALNQRLRTLVTEDPDAAAKSLSDWIDQAG